jgi:hypothetical protein
MAIEQGGIPVFPWTTTAMLVDLAAIATPPKKYIKSPLAKVTPKIKGMASAIQFSRTA